MARKDGWAQIGSYFGAPTTLNLSVVSANTQLLPNSYYRLWSSVNAFFLFGTSNVVATTASNPLAGGLDIMHKTDATNVYCAAITSSGTGVLYVSLISMDF